ncbi:MAG: VOC family protein [Actinobacteria bacterium]|nr:VOC family protein [Actinomycetota bacterium]
MGERTSYEPGTFSWADLSTPDQEAAKTFYSELFGWTANDMPAGEGVTYSMMQLDGREAAAVAPQPEQQRQAGAPPMWNSYVTVESADVAAERASQLGATVHAPPFDVMEAGRMSVIQDPQGAFFMVWEPRQTIGARVVNAPGALAWNELATTDVDGAAAFYGELFGWTMQPFEAAVAQGYQVIQNKGRGNGGIREMAEGEPVPYWLVYFGVEGIDGSLSKAEELGGTRLMGPADIGVAKIAMAQDPHGAAFAIYDGQFED